MLVKCRQIVAKGLFLISSRFRDESRSDPEVTDGIEFDLHGGQAGYTAAKLMTPR